MARLKQETAFKPESEPKLSHLARRLLREAEATGVLPTPLDVLFEIAKLRNVAELPDDTFLETLSEKAKGYFRSAKQKLRGIADLRERVVYVPRSQNRARDNFARAHELGHQTIPWHNVDPAYFDDAETLGPDAKALFEQEANFFGSEIIFQGDGFQRIARDYQPSFDAVFALADMHASSRQAAAWRLVEDHDEALALMQYYPVNAVDDEGNNVLNAWLSVNSPLFSRRYGGIEWPKTLRTGHQWVAARDIERVCEGADSLNCGGVPTSFCWHSWWNGHALLVLIRQKPRLGLVGALLRDRN